jgi:hypothetical protein
MATLGASGLTLQRPWQVMGGLEAVNDDTVRCEHGVCFHGDAVVLVNARQVRDC